MFKRKIRLVHLQGGMEFYDCDGCTWEGVEVNSEQRDEALRAFEFHVCKDYVSSSS
jgi:hypothetical protein